LNDATAVVNALMPPRRAVKRIVARGRLPPHTPDRHRRTYLADRGRAELSALRPRLHAPARRVGRGGGSVPFRYAWSFGSNHVPRVANFLSRGSFSGFSVASCFW
jgi:hypothetical protein